MPRPAVSGGQLSAMSAKQNGSKQVMAAELRLMQLDTRWAAERLELFQTLETSVQRTMAALMQAASETLAGASAARQSMELEARQLIEEVRAERAALLEEVELLQRERDGLGNEVADALRGAREEIAALRGAAEDEHARMRGAAEDDATRIRRTTEDESARMRRGTEQERTRLLDDAEHRRDELMAEIGGLERQLSGVGSRVHKILARAPAPADPAQIAEEPAPGSEPSAPLLAEKWMTIAVAPETTEAPERSVKTGRDPEPSLAPRPPSMFEVEVGEPSVDGSGVAHEPAETATAADPDVAPAAGPERVQVTLRNTPSFAEALEFERGVRRIGGVRNVRVLQFEAGTLVLQVEHDRDAELAAAIEGLARLVGAVLSRDSDHLEVAFPDAAQRLPGGH